MYHSGEDRVNRLKSFKEAKRQSFKDTKSKEEMKKNAKTRRIKEPKKQNPKKQRKKTQKVKSERDQGLSLALTFKDILEKMSINSFASQINLSTSISNALLLYFIKPNQ